MDRLTREQIKFMRSDAVSRLKAEVERRPSMITSAISAIENEITLCDMALQSLAPPLDAAGIREMCARVCDDIFKNFGDDDAALMCATRIRALDLSTLSPPAAGRDDAALSMKADGMVMVPREPTKEMIAAAVDHDWSGGYDRQGSHASGQYEEYRIGLVAAFGTYGCETAASEIYKAMLSAAPATKGDK